MLRALHLENERERKEKNRERMQIPDLRLVSPSTLEAAGPRGKGTSRENFEGTVGHESNQHACDEIDRRRRIDSHTHTRTCSFENLAKISRPPLQKNICFHAFQRIRLTCFLSFTLSLFLVIINYPPPSCMFTF